MSGNQGQYPDFEDSWDVQDGRGDFLRAKVMRTPRAEVIPETVPRVNSAPVSAGNPMPVGDAAVLAAIVAQGGGQATGALQTAGNASLTSIATASATQATAVGTAADGAWVSGSGTLVAILKAIAGFLGGVLKIAPVSASGTDSSAAAPAVGNVLTSFVVNNPGQYRVQNQSAATLQVIFDSGAGTPTIKVLGPASAPGAQGADTSPEMPWFVGRIRVAGPAGSQFAAIHN